jgi:hypothetical protein
LKTLEEITLDFCVKGSKCQETIKDKFQPVISILSSFLIIKLAYNLIGCIINLKDIDDLTVMFV